MHTRINYTHIQYIHWYIHINTLIYIVQTHVGYTCTLFTSCTVLHVTRIETKFAWICRRNMNVCADLSLCILAQRHRLRSASCLQAPGAFRMVLGYSCNFGTTVSTKSCTTFPWGRARLNLEFLVTYLCKIHIFLSPAHIPAKLRLDFRLGF
jgi:hypothetical protein